MGEKEIIISGPKVDFELYQGSLADVLLGKLKELPKNLVIQVNGENGEEKTVEEFLQMGVEVAEGFKKLELEPGEDIVPIIGNYSWNSIAVALGGILSCIPVFPIDPGLKAIELQHLFESCEPKVIFCESKSAEHVVEALNFLQRKAKIFLLDDKLTTDHRFQKFSQIIQNADPHNYLPPKIKSPEEIPALIVASSGATGLPKGVVLTHTNLIYQLQYYAHYCPSKTYLQLTHMFWISGITATFYPCLTGLKVIFLNDVTPTAILNAIEKYQPYWTFFPPVCLTEVLSHPNLKRYDLSSLKLVRMGGAALPQNTDQRIKTEWPAEADFIQTYGMTEISGGATKPYKDNITSAGFVRSGIQLKIVDTSNGETLGPREIGELRIKAGYGTMKGYLKNEKATREAFDATGFYRSGDLGYYTEDGSIFIVGRIKELIKFRNHQVSPSELESFILNLPGVKDVGVVGVPHDVDLYRPKALVVKEAGSEITEKDIIKWVSENLSEHKQLYGGVTFVESIPRTPSGKIKRFLLEKMMEII